MLQPFLLSLTVHCIPTATASNLLQCHKPEPLSLTNYFTCQLTEKVKIIKHKRVPLVFSAPPTTPVPIPTHILPHSFWLPLGLGERVLTYRTQASYLCIGSHHFLLPLEAAWSLSYILNLPLATRFSSLMTGSQVSGIRKCFSAVLPSGAAELLSSSFPLTHFHQVYLCCLHFLINYLFLHPMPMDFDLYHFSKTAFKAIKGLFTTKSKCLFLDPLLLLTFWKHSPSVFWKSLVLCDLFWEFTKPSWSTFAFYFICLSSSFSSASKTNTIQYMHSISWVLELHLWGLDPDFTSDRQGKLGRLFKSSEAALRNKWDHACTIYRIVPGK